MGGSTLRIWVARRSPARMLESWDRNWQINRETWNTMRLKDKICIVTGAANGIGKAIAEALAEQGGWVLVADLDRANGEQTVKEILARGGRAEFSLVDVSNPSHVDSAVKVAASKNNRIDV